MSTGAATSDPTPAPTLALAEVSSQTPESTGAVMNHRAVRAVIAALESAGMSDAAALIRIMPDGAPTAAAAAAGLGCSVGAIANSLMFEVAGNPLLILTSGGHRVDTKSLGPRLGLSKSAIKRAKPDFVKLYTGQTIGGVAPVGHPAPIRTLVDEELAKFDILWAAGGHHQTVFPTDFDSLAKMTNGEIVKVD